MFYESTRGKSEKVSALKAILEGIAPDKGLFIPEEIPFVPDLCDKMINMSYPERCASVLSLFIDEVGYGDLLKDCESAYKDFYPSPAPLTFLDSDKAVLELFHGPTCAFKDMALKVMPKLLSRAINKYGEGKNALILTATSGDTGKAALEGYKDIDRIRIMVFYPDQGVSDIQKLQMRTQEGNNVSVVAIDGNFDDAQSGVKSIFADKEIAEKLYEKGYFLTSANSINWGRLAPQIAYYFSLASDIRAKGINKTIDVAVPTGNFGNILAAYYAKRMGAPIGKLICASNSNDVLTVFFKTGTYDRNREFFKTISPSMDILLSSNLERLLSIIAGRKACNEYMEKLAKDGKYTVDEKTMNEIRSVFTGISCSEENCEKTIKKVFDEYKYLIDPHTAVAFYAQNEYSSDNFKAIVSTASAFKFAPAVIRSLSPDYKGSDPAKALSDLTGYPTPENISSLSSKKIRFSKVIDKNDMSKEVLKF